ncbi:MAG: ABC transporter permease [Thermoplasmata archaeon]
MKIGPIILRGYVLAFFVLLYLPIVILVILGFNENRVVYVWTGFTTDKFAQVFSIQAYQRALNASLLIAFGTTALSAVLGTLAGIAGARFTSLRFELAWTTLILLPLIIPEIVEALSLILFYQAIGIPNGVAATILGHTVFCVSIVALIVRTRMADVGRALEEASMVLGANRFVTFFRVLLPIAAPAIIAGSFLGFAASFDDVIKSSFTTDAATQTLPLIVFAQAHRGGITPTIAALSAVMVAISLAAALVRVTAERRFSRG